MCNAVAICILPTRMWGNWPEERRMSEWCLCHNCRGFLCFSWGGIWYSAGKSEADSIRITSLFPVQKLFELYASFAQANTRILAWIDVQYMYTAFKQNFRTSNWIHIYLLHDNLFNIKDFSYHERAILKTNSSFWIFFSVINGAFQFLNVFPFHDCLTHRFLFLNRVFVLYF